MRSPLVYRGFGKKIFSRFDTVSERPVPRSSFPSPLDSSTAAIASMSCRMREPGKRPRDVAVRAALVLRDDEYTLIAAPPVAVLAALISPAYASGCPAIRARARPSVNPYRPGLR